MGRFAVSVHSVHGRSAWFSVQFVSTQTLWLWVPFIEATTSSPASSPVSSTAFIAASLYRAVSLSPSPAPWSEPCSVAASTNAVAVPLPTASDCAASAAVGTNCVAMHRASRILKNRFFIASSSFGVGPSSTLSPGGSFLPPRGISPNGREALPVPAPCPASGPEKEKPA